MSNYYTRVFAIPTRVPDDDDESLPQPSVILSCHVQSYCSLSKVQGRTGGRICERSFSYRAEHPSTPFASRYHSPSSPWWAIVSSMMEGMLLPFPLDRIQWLDMNAGKYASRTCITRDELVSEIARVLSREVNDKGRKRTKVMVSMTHVVTVSESEIHESHELNCVICAEEIVMGDQLVRMHCSHEFHQGCIEAWLKIHRTCPLRRCELPAKMS